MREKLFLGEKNRIKKIIPVKKKNENFQVTSSFVQLLLNEKM